MLVVTFYYCFIIVSSMCAIFKHLAECYKLFGGSVPIRIRGSIFIFPTNIRMCNLTQGGVNKWLLPRLFYRKGS